MKIHLIILIGLVSAAAAAETNTPFKLSFPRWGPSLRGGSVYNFDTAMDKGGSFSVNRYFLEAGVARMWALDRMLAFSAGFGQDDYRFSGTTAQPWNNIDNYRASLFARWGFNDKWVLFAGPSVRSYGESGVDLDDALTLALFGGVSYQFGDRLTLGPGIGIFEQIEEGVRYVPIILVNWRITENLSLETGGGLAATAGPGLSLVYAFSDKWKAGLTGRYEKKRFRLNGDNPVSPNGVGEDRNTPIVANLSYFFYPAGYVSGIIGYNFAGNLAIEDKNGTGLFDTDYEPSPQVGLVASFRF